MSNNSSEATISNKMSADGVRSRGEFKLTFPKGIAVFKLICDILFTLMALPMILMTGLILLVLNPFFNPGPLLYTQERMGKNRRKFTMWKFRTMLPEVGTVRAHDAEVESHRITALGRFLRKTRCDELPNFFNVLRGEMSVLGPRPDAWDHAEIYLKTVPHYGHRFRLRPGISGLAQVRCGYADSQATIRRKARLDRIYVERHDVRIEMHIIAKTLNVIMTGHGAK